jgi:cytochrome oxidase Cu insertion factor (SCO1/SenC/PrrC family)
VTLRTLVLSLALALPGGLTAADSPSDLDRVTVGKAAPDFRLPDGDNKEHSLAERRGEPVIVVFYRGHW